MLAIATRFHGPTNTRGSRYSAHVMEHKNIFTGKPQRKLSLQAQDALSSEANHRRVAKALIEQLGWTEAHGYGNWIEGATSKGYVYVCDTKYGQDRLFADSQAVAS